jgi:hypothetical protein
MGLKPGRPRAATRVTALFAAMLLAGGLGACSGGGSESASSDVQAQGEAGAGSDTSGADPSSPEAAQGGVNRAVIQTKAMIKTGQVAVTSTDLDRARDEVDQLLFGFGGSIDNEQTSHDRDGNIERSTLVVRVPVAKFKAAMDALEKLGKMRTSESTSKDVTTQLIDVDERVETLQTSLDRLQDYQRDSENIDDLIRFEDQITERESELQSLKAQQSYLADQTSMATITVYLSTPDKFVEPPDALEDAGFVTGLRGGWNALLDFVVVALTVLGAVLPFAIASALVGVPTWLLVRALVRRRTAPEPAPDPDAT